MVTKTIGGLGAAAAITGGGQTLFEVEQTPGPTSGKLTDDQLKTWAKAGFAAADITDSTATGRSILTASNAAAVRTAAGVVIGTDVQAFSAVLATLAGASANGQSLVTAANYTAMKTLLGLTIGTDVQAFNSNLTTLAGIRNNNAATTSPGVSDDNTAASPGPYAVGSRWLRTDTGAQWTCRDASTGAAKWDKLANADHPGYIANWYVAPFPGTLAAGGAVLANVITLIPWMVLERCTLSSLLIRITTAGTNTGLAVYASNPTTKRPTGTDLGHTLLAGTATGSVTTFDIALTANPTLEPGLYWLGANQDNALQVYQAYSASSVFFPFLIGSGTIAKITSGTSSGINYLSVAQAFGTWPDMTSASFTEGTDNKWALIYPHVTTVP